MPLNSTRKSSSWRDPIGQQSPHCRYLQHWAVKVFGAHKLKPPSANLSHKLPETHADLQHSTSPPAATIMIDPFTFATGVAGLLSLTLELSKVIGEYTCSVKHFPKEAHELANELMGLSQVLEQLATFLRSEDVRRNSFDETSVLFLVTTNCQAKIETVLQKFPRIPQTSKSRPTFERFIWPFKEKEISKTIELLNRYTQTFQLSLTTRGW
jgi:hypothetical protein